MSTSTDECVSAPADKPSPRRRRPRAPRGTVHVSVPTAGPAEVSSQAVLRRHRAIVTVLGVYVLAAAFVVPTMTPAPVGDDWVYARSVEILLRDGELRILDLSVVTLVFQVAWGALFAAVFGLDFGALRLSTVTITLLGGWSCYALCRELGIERGRSALGAAAYLFNPLAFVLGFSFMTDAHFAALLVIASLSYVRGLRWWTGSRISEGTGSSRVDVALLGGSVAAACAFLVRQQGAMIPVAVILALLLNRQLRPDRRSAALVARVAAAPTAAAVAYYLWLVFVHGVPTWQTNFVRALREAGWEESWLLAERMTFIEVMYLGFFALPVVAAALRALVRLPRFDSALAWGLVAGWASALVVGLFAFGAYRRESIPPMPLMPYVPQYLGPHGLGPADLHGSRAWLVGWGALVWATSICAVASLLFALILCRRVARPPRLDPTRLAAGVTLAIALGQVVGVLPPSFHFRTWIISVDRYLLPLLPFALCLTLWALRDVRLALPLGWAVVAAFALVAVAGTRDFLVFQDATWKMARIATGMGVPLTRLDGGASWDGYHLYEYSRANNIPTQTPLAPWWVDLFAPATNSDYIVSAAPLWGYNVISVIEYSSWLEDDPTYLFLLQRQGVSVLPPLPVPPGGEDLVAWHIRTRQPAATTTAAGRGGTREAFGDRLDVPPASAACGGAFQKACLSDTDGARRAVERCRRDQLPPHAVAGEVRC